MGTINLERIFQGRLEGLPDVSRSLRDVKSEYCWLENVIPCPTAASSGFFPLYEKTEVSLELLHSLSLPVNHVRG